MALTWIVRPRHRRAAWAIVAGHHAAYLAGGRLARWFPDLARRRFRL